VSPRGLQEGFAQLLEQFDPHNFAARPAPPPMRVPLTERVGQDTHAIDHTIVLDRTYSHTVHIPNQSPVSIVHGMSEAFQQCLADLEDDLRAINLKA